MSQGQLCPRCMSHSLDHFGHHALSCKKGSDVVSNHNRIRDTVWVMKLNKCVLLIPNWELGKPAAFDLCVISPLNSETLQVACVILSSAAMQAEERKHHSKDAKCGELGWVCIPLVVESFGSWGPEAQRSLTRLAGSIPCPLNAETLHALALQLR